MCKRSQVSRGKSHFSLFRHKVFGTRFLALRFSWSRADPEREVWISFERIAWLQVTPRPWCVGLARTVYVRRMPYMTVYSVIFLPKCRIYTVNNVYIYLCIYGSGQPYWCGWPLHGSFSLNNVEGAVFTACVALFILHVCNLWRLSQMNRLTSVRSSSPAASRGWEVHWVPCQVVQRKRMHL